MRDHSPTGTDRTVARRVSDPEHNNSPDAAAYGYGRGVRAGDDRWSGGVGAESGCRCDPYNMATSLNRFTKYFTNSCRKTPC